MRSMTRSRGNGKAHAMASGAECLATKSHLPGLWKSAQLEGGAGRMSIALASTRSPLTMVGQREGATFRRRLGYPCTAIYSVDREAMMAVSVHRQRLFSSQPPHGPQPRALKGSCRDGGGA